MRYFLSDNGGWLTISGDDALGTIPPGYREVTEGEFNEGTGTITLPAPEVGA